jgi:hypothetical protein
MFVLVVVALLSSVAAAGVVIGRDGDSGENPLAVTDRGGAESLPRYGGPEFPAAQPAPIAPTDLSSPTTLEVPLPTSSEVSPSTSFSVSGPTEPAPSTTVLSCRNSYDPACGQFSWDPLPLDQPASVIVSFQPTSPRAGEWAEVTITVEDPDASYVSRVEMYTDCSEGNIPGYPCAYDGPQPGVDLGPCERATGQWDLPPRPPAPLRSSTTYRLVYEEAAEYEWAVVGSAEGDVVDVGGANRCGVESPYVSHFEVKGTVVVVP